GSATDGGWPATWPWVGGGLHLASRLARLPGGRPGYRPLRVRSAKSARHDRGSGIRVELRRNAAGSGSAEARGRGPRHQLRYRHQERSGGRGCVSASGRGLRDGSNHAPAVEGPRVEINVSVVRGAGEPGEPQITGSTAARPGASAREWLLRDEPS